MNGFLIDTNVLSEYSRPDGPDVRVRAWLETAPRELQYVSVINLAEIKKGIELLAEGRRRRELQNWLANELEDWFSGHILPVDRRVADCWAQLAAGGIKIGRPLPTIDSLIAALEQRKFYTRHSPRNGCLTPRRDTIVTGPNG